MTRLSPTVREVRRLSGEIAQRLAELEAQVRGNGVVTPESMAVMCAVVQTRFILEYTERRYGAPLRMPRAPRCTADGPVFSTRKALDIFRGTQKSRRKK